MARQELRTFKDILDAVCDQMRIPSNDTETRRRMKRNINEVYLNEVVPHNRWSWLRTTATLQTDPYFNNGGTAAVTQNDTAVTLTQAPSSSRVGQYFAIDGDGEAYRIAAHEPGAFTLVLETPYNGSTATASAFKIWGESIGLPANCKEVVEVRHDYLTKPLEGKGLQEFRRIQSAGSPLAQGRPAFHSTQQAAANSLYESISGFLGFTSISSTGLVRTLYSAQDLTQYFTAGDRIKVSSITYPQYAGEQIVSSVSAGNITYTAATLFEQDELATGTVSVLARGDYVSMGASRSLLLYPALSNKRTTLVVDYLVNVQALEDDTDEPLMPIEDRIVLYYGAMWLSYERDRNPEAAMQQYGQMQRKLERMKGKTEDSPDRPVMRISGNYLSTKRRGQGRRNWAAYGTEDSGRGGGGGNVVTGTANTVATFDENGNLVGNSDVDLTALEFLLGAQGGLSETIAPSSTNAVIDSWSAVTYKAAHVSYRIERGSVHETGMMFISTNGSTISISSPVGLMGVTGVTFDADLFSGNMRLLATSDGSGASAVIYYRVLLF